MGDSYWAATITLLNTRSSLLLTYQPHDDAMHHHTTPKKKVFEFVSGEHTAKNIMIAAVKRPLHKTMTR